MEYTAMEQYWIWLSSVEGIGPKKFYQLLSVFEDPRQVWDNIGDQEIDALGPVSARSLRKARSEEYFYRLFADLESTGVRAVPRISDDYPAMLGEIYDPPVTLFVRGNADLSPEKAIGIVGSRRASRDGQRAAREFARTLAENGVTVISGMARGIDTCAHRGSLEAGGPTVAVLGSGPDVVYPPENDQLAQEILDTGGALISEYPPRTQPLSGHFPARNRIISGMCSGLLLVEGDKRSGAMITVNFATEQGRDVFAVPGSIYAALSQMPNRLILEGAHPALSGDDILAHYRWDGPSAAKPKERGLPEDLDPAERSIAEPLTVEDYSFDELQRITGIEPAKLNSHLTMLILRGIIVKAPGGMYHINL